MRKALTLVLAGALAMVLGVSSAGAQSFDIDFRAQLQASHEVQEPPVVSPATGRAVFDVKGSGPNAAIAYRLFVRDIDEVVAAHIHLGCAGENGPVVVTLFSGGPTGTVNGVLASGLITRDDLEGPLAGRGIAALIRAMQSGCTYVNVHTVDYPAGEIRGQIQQVSEIP